MAYELFISRRYLTGRRKEAFISLISFISTAGVALGVMALVVVIAVMTGAERKLRDNLLGIAAHVTVLSHTGEIEDPEEALRVVRRDSEVKAASPVVQLQVLLRGPSGSSGAVIKGIDPATGARVVDISRYLKSGSLSDLSPSQEEDGAKARPGIILGRDLAVSLGAARGDVVSIISPKGTLSPIGHVPTVRRVTVAGVLDSGWYEYDSAFAWMNLSDAQNIGRLGHAVTGIETALKDPMLAPEAAARLRRELALAPSSAGIPTLYAQDWMRMYKPLWDALLLEKLAMFVILMFIVLVAAFNIASTLIMMVMEKKKDIAILKAMGAKKRSIVKIFMMNGMTIGVVGTGMGVSLGSILCYVQKTYEVVSLDRTVYPFGVLPVQMEFLDVALISIAAIVICLGATLYPAWQASRLDPVDTIRYG
ncbi:MAG: lipoprotein-releasing ABC transporter permease subunit [Thermodesulfobacteriota bacterium]